MIQHKVLREYLTKCYNRDVLHESGNVPVPQAGDDLLAAAKAELARIDALKLGASLASRDFVSYQNRRVLEALVGTLEVSGRMVGTEARDTAHFTGTKT